MYSGIRKMKFIDYYKRLKEKYINHILIIQRGNFYVAINTDAEIIHDILRFKLRLQKTGDYEVGFPLNSLEKNKKNIEVANYRLAIVNETEKYDEETGAKKREVAEVQRIERENKQVSDYKKVQSKKEETILLAEAKRLVKKIYQITENAPKKYRYSLVTKLQNLSVEILEEVCNENMMTEEKKKLYAKIQTIEYLLVILKETNSITTKQQGQTAQIIFNLIKSIIN